MIIFPLTHFQRLSKSHLNLYSTLSTKQQKKKVEKDFLSSLFSLLTSSLLFLPCNFFLCFNGAALVVLFLVPSIFYLHQSCFLWSWRYASEADTRFKLTNSTFKHSYIVLLKLWLQNVLFHFISWFYFFKLFFSPLCKFEIIFTCMSVFNTCELINFKSWICHCQYALHWKKIEEVLRW